MDDKVYENLKYIRSSLSGQLRGKQPYYNIPLQARWQAPGLAHIYHMETGESSWGKGDSQHLRFAIITLLYEQIPQAVRLREYLKAAAEALRAKPGVKEVYSPLQQQIWVDLIGRPKYNPTLTILDTEVGPVFRVRHGNYVCGWLEINKALQYWDVNTLRKELSKLYYIGVQLTEGDECGVGLMDLPSGTTYEPLEH